MSIVRITDLHKPVQSEALLNTIAQLESVDIKLDRQTILGLAKEKLDVPINIEDGFFERFESYAGEVINNAPTHAYGRYFLQNLAVEGVIETSRLKYMQKTYPEISQTSIHRPLIMAGIPRSGSTFLLKLISTAPLMTLMRWECVKTFPSKAVLDGHAPDTRREEALSIHEANASLAPKFRALHDVSGVDTTEEVELQTRRIQGVLPAFFGDCPNYDNDFYNKAQTECYESLYEHLQALQWMKKAKPNERWFLKSPQHLGALPELKAVFPDAAVIFTHRDPASVFTSLVTLMGYSVRCTYSEISKDQLLDRARRMQHGFLRGLVKNADIFDKSTHIYFRELKKDYHECMERVFAIADMPYDDAAQKKVTDQASAYRRGRQGRVVYDLEQDFGLTRDQVREEFSYYLDKFPVQLEDKN